MRPAPSAGTLAFRLVGLFTLFCAGAAEAQAVRGTVRTAAGEPLAGATVAVYDRGQGWGGVDRLRATEYGRLDAQGVVYLDYTGGALHADSQIRRHADLLANRVFGNPHSASRSSAATTALVEETRRRVLRFFNAPPDEYTAVFTTNATAATTATSARP